MESKYADWIAINVEESYGRCDEVTQAMAAAFPELSRVRGWYHCPIWGDREHWWLETSEGNRIDPTVSQFPSKGIGEYEPFPDGAEEPSGMCSNCGGYIYGGGDACSEACHRSYVAYLMDPL